MEEQQARSGLKRTSSKELIEKQQVRSGWKATSKERMESNN
jgi:hypothetical protein